jgi:hypothetical protein
MDYLVGPWEVDLGPGMKLSIQAISAIDPFIGLGELSPIKNPTCAHVGTTFHSKQLLVMLLSYSYSLYP